ncbi:MAG: hypothetical protein WKG01_26715 [Kofleriaceae bacterium]
MARLTDKLLVAVYVALAALPVISMVTRIDGRPMAGVLDPTPRPRAPNLHRFVTEKYQHKLVAWFEASLGMKGTSMALDNGLLYQAFGETKPYAPVRAGTDGVLFSDDDINHLNKRGPYLPNLFHVHDLASRMAVVQRQLAAQHRAFVPVLVPSKTSIWRDKVPAAWLMPLTDPPESDLRGYLAMKQALDARGVQYVDARAMFAKHRREDVFGPLGRHWTAYGACLTMNEVVTTYARLTGTPRLPYDCRLVYARGDVANGTDYDLLRLMNAIGVSPQTDQVPTAMHDTPPPGPRPHVLFVGTSFCWELTHDAHASKLFGSLSLNFYNQTFITYLDPVHQPVKPYTHTWRRFTMGKDLYVLDLFESYLGAPGAYVPFFLEELRSELAGESRKPDPEPPAP